MNSKSSTPSLLSKLNELREWIISEHPHNHMDAVSVINEMRGYLQSESGDTTAPSAFYSEPENCRGCGKPLLVENAWMFDGCPCNTRAGVNDGNLWRWKLLSDLQQRQSRELEAKQAKIDALMLEYCPEEMTKEQTENWARHQRPATEEESRAIDAAALTPSATVERWTPVAEGSLPRNTTAESLLVMTITGSQRIEVACEIYGLFKDAQRNGEDCFFTHWMPLPAAPVDSRSNDA